MTRDQVMKTKMKAGRHCEERSDDAIHLSFRNIAMDCFASLAMTKELNQSV